MAHIKHTILADSADGNEENSVEISAINVHILNDFKNTITTHELDSYVSNNYIYHTIADLLYLIRATVYI